MLRARMHRLKFKTEDRLDLYLSGDVLFDIENKTRGITGSGGLGMAKDDLDFLQSGVTNYITFLKSVDCENSKGIVTVVFIYSPYDINECSVIGSPFENSSNIHPCTVSVDIEVDLDDDVDDGAEVVVANPFHSKGASDYICNEWLDKCGTWSNPSLRLCELAKDRRLYGSNNSLEGKFNQEKNLDSTFRDSCSSTGQLITKRWDDGRGIGRLLDIEARKAHVEKKCVGRLTLRPS